MARKSSAAIAYEQGKLIGVLSGTGGITTALPALEASLAIKQTGAELMYDEDPTRLLDRLLHRYRSDEYDACASPLDVAQGRP